MAAALIHCFPRILTDIWVYEYNWYHRMSPYLIYTLRSSAYILPNHIDILLNRMHKVHTYPRLLEQAGWVEFLRVTSVAFMDGMILALLVEVKFNIPDWARWPFLRIRRTWCKLSGCGLLQGRGTVEVEFYVPYRTGVSSCS